MKIEKVAIIGSTGNMGANIAGIFASFGNATVYMIGRDNDKINKSIKKAIKSVRSESIKTKLVPVNIDDLEEYVSKSDLVFECVSEDIETKQNVAKRIGNAIKKDSIACTGTSGLSVTALAECFAEENRKRFFGVHLFNPPYSNTLCEFISTKYSDDDVKKQLKDYLKNVLYRTVVDVDDSPGFLGNRIGFQFINEALQYAQLYKDNGGIDYIDAILGPFTGRIMAPLMTSDFVGLDVHKAIVENLYNNTNDYAHETFVLPDFANKLICEGKLGSKSGLGLYQRVVFDDGRKEWYVYDINTESYRERTMYAFSFAEKMKKYVENGNYTDAITTLINNKSQEAKICLTFLLKYIIYSLFTSKNVAHSISAADDVMATGFNWCPPLALVELFEEVCDLKQIIKETIGLDGLKVDIDELLDEAVKSKYDYRRFFRSGR